MKFSLFFLGEYSNMNASAAITNFIINTPGRERGGTSLSLRRAWFSGLPRPSQAQGRANQVVLFVAGTYRPQAPSLPLPHLFHGMRARSMPIPQVSVMPANSRPAPTNAESPISKGGA